jgi:hypothetical protein
LATNVDRFQHSAMSTTAPNGLEELPPGLIRDVGVILPLATSGFLEHFLERFLETTGRWLRVPWWLVHAGLYLLTGLVAARCVNLAKLFPGGPGMALWGVFAAESTFTTWMLVHLRQARTLALLTATRIESGADRLTWLRRFYGPMHWGWVIRDRNDPRRYRRTMRLGLLPLTLLLMASFYVYLLWPALESGSPGLWLIFSFHLLGCYPLAAKAAMLLTVLAHFWLLRGLVKVARGTLPNTLTENARARLWAEIRRWALRLNLIVALATGAWMYIHAISVGPTIWPYALTVGLMALFLTQGIILGDLRLQSATLVLVLAQSAQSLISALRGLSPAYSRCDAWVALASLACPVAGGFAGTLVKHLASQ